MIRGCKSGVQLLKQSWKKSMITWVGTNDWNADKGVVFCFLFCFFIFLFHPPFFVSLIKNKDNNKASDKNKKKKKKKKKNKATGG